MGKESLSIPEEYLDEFIKVIRNGLMTTRVHDETREGLLQWCAMIERDQRIPDSLKENPYWHQKIVDI